MNQLLTVKQFANKHPAFIHQRLLDDKSRLPRHLFNNGAENLLPKKFRRWGAALGFAAVAAVFISNINDSDTTQSQGPGDSEIAEEDISPEATMNPQEIIDGKFRAALVYIGMFDPAKIENNNSAAVAFNKVLSDYNYMPLSGIPIDKAIEQQKSFTDFTNWKPNSHALEILKKFSTGAMLSSRLEDDLKSNDPSRIKLAQNYMSFLGKNVSITGKIDKKTIRAAHELIREPLKIPDGLIGPNGDVDSRMIRMMGVYQHLYAPVDALDPDDLSIAMSLPLSIHRRPADVNSRERYTAMRLIFDDPNGYKVLVCKENIRRSKIDLSYLLGKNAHQFDPVIVNKPSSEYECKL